MIDKIIFLTHTSLNKAQPGDSAMCTDEDFARWLAKRDAREATYNSWSRFAKTNTAKGYPLTDADRDALRPVSA